jgi:DNA-binding NarL/FixJ family response regulator
MWRETRKAGTGSVNIRILVADDFAPWRRFVSSMILLKAPEWQIVCEVEDGLEAVKKAKELMPDLILMDIGLDKLDGIEAARQIRKFAPDLKMLFVSAFDSREVVEEALHTGASGYVVKLDAASELIEAVEAVSQGRQFVSSRIRGRISVFAANAQASVTPIRDEVLESRLAEPPEGEGARCHEVQFYSDDEVLLESMTHFIGAALKIGNAAIVVATKPHRDMLLERLKAQGVDVDALIQQGAYLSLDAADTLSTFMINDWPDADRFLESFSKLIESTLKAAKAKHPRVAIFGEGVALLWAKGKKEATIRLEQLSNDLAQTRKVDILCAYPLSLDLQEDKPSFTAICREHSALHAR